MKRIITCLTALLLAALCGTGLTEVKGKYTWKGHPIEVTHIENFTKLSPQTLKDNEYTVAVSMGVEKDIWKDKKLQSAFYEEAALMDPQGAAYSPQLSGTGADEPLWVFFFCVPRTVSLEELTFSPGKNGKKANETAGQAGQPADGPAVLTAEDGSTVALTPADAENFRTQADKEIVHTRIGDTARSISSDTPFSPKRALYPPRSKSPLSVRSCISAYLSRASSGRSAREKTYFIPLPRPAPGALLALIAPIFAWYRSVRLGIPIRIAACSVVKSSDTALSSFPVQ